MGSGMVQGAGVAGGGWRRGPQGLLPGRVLQRVVEQIINEDGVVLAVVDVPVICSDKFLQFLFFGVEVRQLQFIDRVADASFPWRIHRCSSWRKWLTCPLCATSGACRDSAENCGGSAVCAHRQGGRCPCCAGRRSGLGTVEVPQIQFIARVVELQFSTETGAFSRVMAAVKGFLEVFPHFSRAPPDCPGVECQFSEPSMTKSSSSSRAPLHNQSSDEVDINALLNARVRNNHNNHNNHTQPQQPHTNTTTTQNHNNHTEPQHAEVHDVPDVKSTGLVVQEFGARWVSLKDDLGFPSTIFSQRRRADGWFERYCAELAKGT